MVYVIAVGLAVYVIVAPVFAVKGVVLVCQCVGVWWSNTFSSSFCVVTTVMLGPTWCIEGCVPVCLWCERIGKITSYHIFCSLYNLFASVVQVCQPQLGLLVWKSTKRFCIASHVFSNYRVKYFSFYQRVSIASYANRWYSQRRNVRPSVHPSVALRYCIKTKKASVMISLPSKSLNILVSRNIWFITKFDRGHPERGRLLRLECVQTGDFGDFSTNKPPYLRNGAR